MNFLDRSICSAAFANAIAFSAAVMALACLNTSAFAQESEIEIVNQDGERVEGAKLMVGPEAGQVELDDVTDTRPKSRQLPTEIGRRKTDLYR